MLNDPTYTETAKIKNGLFFQKYIITVFTQPDKEALTPTEACIDKSSLKGRGSRTLATVVFLKNTLPKTRKRCQQGYMVTEIRLNCCCCFKAKARQNADVTFQGWELNGLKILT